MMPVHGKKTQIPKNRNIFFYKPKNRVKKMARTAKPKTPKTIGIIYHNISNECPKCHKKAFFYIRFFSGREHPREDKPDLYYWAEITGEHTQTFNITDTKAINDHWPCD